MSNTDKRIKQNAGFVQAANARANQNLNKAKDLRAQGKNTAANIAEGKAKAGIRRAAKAAESIKKWAK